MQWNDGPDKSGSDSIGNEDLGAKRGGDESDVRRWTAQPDVQELELKQHSALQELVQETQEALSELEEQM